ncbi:MAG: hypothetical protein ACR2PJ_04130, partial [Pseudomonadales bacterium]
AQSPSSRQARQTRPFNLAAKASASASAIVHLAEPDEPRWRWLPLLLAAAFLVRALVALAGDFVLHPDEVMQYLEPAHKLVFGSGASYWEFFYGGRSWLIPSLVAAALFTADTLGLGEPWFYIPLVKLLFCALSLLIPLGMYGFGRRHFGEAAGRIALLLGCFWYELIVFAHKPMTEFTATALLFGMLAMVSAVPCSARRGLALALLATLVAAVRMQYAPIAGLVLLIEFARTTNHGRLAILAGGLAGLFAIGLFEKLTWGGWFYSYILNVRVNFAAVWAEPDMLSYFQVPIWLVMGSCGLALIALAAGAVDWRRRGWLLFLCLLLLLFHSFQAHKEYRFIFMVIPLWLMLLADFAAAHLPRLFANGAVASQQSINWQAWSRPATCLALALAISLAGIFNGLPWLKPRFDPDAEDRFNHLYRAFTQERGMVGFLRDQDPHFRIYRKLAADDTMTGVLDASRSYFGTGGYYYLHKSVPFYDQPAAWEAITAPTEVHRYASHLVAGQPMEVIERSQTAEGVNFLVVRYAEGEPRRDDGQDADRFGLRLPAYVPQITKDAPQGRLVYWDEQGQSTILQAFTRDMEFTEDVLTLWHTQAPTEVMQWKSYQPISVTLDFIRLLAGSSAPTPPVKFNIEFAEP